MGSEAMWTLWAKLLKPDVLTNVLDALSFILITPELVGPEKLSRFVERVDHVMLSFAKIMDRYKCFWNGVTIVFWGVPVIAFGLAFIWELSEGAGLLSRRERKAMVEFVMIPVSIWYIVFFLFGGLMGALFIVVRVAAHFRLGRLIALMLGIGCFFLSRAVAIWDRWGAP